MPGPSTKGKGKVVTFVMFAYKTEYCYLDCLVSIALLSLFGTVISEYVRGGSSMSETEHQSPHPEPAHVYGYTVYFLLCPVGQLINHSQILIVTKD